MTEIELEEIEGTDISNSSSERSSEFEEDSSQSPLDSKNERPNTFGGGIVKVILCILAPFHACCDVMFCNFKVKRIIMTVVYINILATSGFYISSTGISVLELVEVCGNCTTSNLGWLFISRSSGSIFCALIYIFIYDFLRIRKKRDSFCTIHTIHKWFFLFILLDLNFYIFPLSNSLWQVLVCGALQGSTFGITINSVTKCVSTFYPDRRSFSVAIQLVHAFFGLGAFIYPFFVGTIISFGFSSRANLIIIWYVIFTLQIPLLLFLWCCESPYEGMFEEEQKEEEEKTEESQTCCCCCSSLKKEKIKNLYTCACLKKCLFECVTFPFRVCKTCWTFATLIYILSSFMTCFYVAAESSFSFLAASYVVNGGIMSKASSSFLTAAFFGSYTIGRFLFTFVSIFDIVPSHIYLHSNLMGLLSVMSLYIVFPTNSGVIWVCMIGMGFFFSSTYSFLYGISMSMFDIPLQGYGTNFLVVGASIGVYGSMVATNTFSVHPTSYLYCVFFYVFCLNLLFWVIWISGKCRIVTTATFDHFKELTEEEEKINFFDDDEESSDDNILLEEI